MDLFGSASLYRRAHGKIAAGMVAELEGRPPRSADAASKLVLRALDALAESRGEIGEGTGIGTTLHGRAEGVVFGAVIHEGQLFHALAAGA
jgi:hypothetical protein